MPFILVLFCISLSLRSSLPNTSCTFGLPSRTFSRSLSFYLLFFVSFFSLFYVLHPSFIQQILSFSSRYVISLSIRSRNLSSPTLPPRTFLCLCPLLPYPRLSALTTLTFLTFQPSPRKRRESGQEKCLFQSDMGQ